MSERLHVASRKGLFTLERSGGWHVARMDFLGDNCSAILTDPRDGGHSFEHLTDGLPQEHAYDICFRHALDVDASGLRLEAPRARCGFRRMVAIAGIASLPTYCRFMRCVSRSSRRSKIK